jgi:uncharacterized protein (UPF0333 family)
MIRLGLANNKGQAAAEMAILGVLVLLAFSFVMNFGQSLGTVQQTKMNSFRKAMKKAYEKNGTVAYTLRKNSNLANINAGFFQGQDSTVEGSYSVTWAKGQSGPDGTSDEGMYSYWQINNMVPVALPTKAQYQYGPTGQESDEKIKTPYSVFRVDEVRTGTYGYELDKKESTGSINYSKQATLIDSSAGILYTRINTNVDKNPGDDNTPTPRYSQGMPSPYIDSQLYRYDQDWNVAHGL